MSTEDPRVLEALEEYFVRDERGLVAVYLFGSHGRGEGRAGSDVDVGLLFDEAPPLSLDGPAATIEDELDGLLGRTVQTVVLNTAPVDLVHRVLRDGRLVHEEDPSRRIRFEVSARARYLDLLPALRRYRRGKASAA